MQIALIKTEMYLISTSFMIQYVFLCMFLLFENCKSCVFEKSDLLCDICPNRHVENDRTLILLSWGIHQKIAFDLCFTLEMYLFHEKSPFHLEPPEVSSSRILLCQQKPIRRFWPPPPGGSESTPGTAQGEDNRRGERLHNDTTRLTTLKGSADRDL